MKIRPDMWDNYTFPYDVNSITHLGPYAYSAFGGVTIIDKYVLMSFIKQIRLCISKKFKHNMF